MSLSNTSARALLATALAAALLASTSCSMLHRKDGSVRFLPHHKSADYAKSQENRPLEVPPDLDTPATDPAMQIPSVNGRAANIGYVQSAAGSTGPAFSVADTVAGTWERLGRALDRIDGVTITQRAQLLNGYDVQYKGATMLLRANSSGAQSTQVDTVGADGKPVRTPEAVELLNLLRERIG